MLDWLRGDRYPCVRRVVLVTKGSETENSTFRGILWEQRGGYLVLKETELLGPRGAVTALVGDTLVERSNVKYLQVLGAAD